MSNIAETTQEMINNCLHDNRKKMYKKIQAYVFIAIEKKVKENHQTKAKFSKLIMDNLENKYLVRSYKRVIREAKVDWKELENATKYVILNDKRYVELNEHLYKRFIIETKKLWLDLDSNDNNSKLLTEKELSLYVENIIGFCKKSYNRMSQIKKMKRKYKEKWDFENEDYYKNYYIENKQSFKNRYEKNKLALKEKYENNKSDVKSRAEINQEFNAKRHLDSSNLVLEDALKMLANNEKLTIRALNKTLTNNGEKLGTTQISIYLKELKNEGLIDE